MSKIFVIMGKSATGKDTVYKKLIESKELMLKTAVGYTTRPIRKGERNGVEYRFVTVNEMENLKEKGLIIEHRSYDTVHGEWHYFTVNDEQIIFGKNDYLLISTLEGFVQIRKYFGKDTVIPIYIEVADDIRLERSIVRERKQESPKYAEVCRRYLADEEDFSEEKLMEANIIKRYKNVDLNDCINEIVNDIKSFQI
ncbi:nucleoside/nucleotide kinase family protein [Lachnoclostridium phytofermentans]|uniref:Guanylate kinase/L-type calcium channel region n=1 Tax=Lachnoclostridium phytofermentans (strain ATCC 700394 / DSM 18823 / ISDg) TaxID=357809 RepID=A9KLV3_LACP7|nr:guanylate kinase [Lachnoclostridium phytofermentans]ABX44262.1 guanylate kinase/L-type calcium channel region [Lachnoclostridium phytofermentans ISDg]